jgi:DNA polymerase III delta subunit
MNLLLDKVLPNGTLRCFVFSGEDSVGSERARAAIIGHLEKKCGAITNERFDPSAETIDLFIQRMMSPTLFGDMRVFHFRHAQTLRDDDLDDIDTALASGIPDAFAFIELDGAKKDIARAIKKLRLEKRAEGASPLCLHLEFPRPPDWGIADWLTANTPDLTGRQISKVDAEYLADRVGYDLDLLHSELQKIDLHLPDKTRIDRAAIDHVTGRQREMSSFELAASIGRRDFKAALRVIEALFADTVYLPLVVSAQSRHFWALFRIKKFLEANPEVARSFGASKGFKNPEQTAAAFAIGKAAGLLDEKGANRVFPVIIKSGVVNQAASFTSEELERILGWLLEFDHGIKTGRIDPGKQALQMLCYRCIRVRDLPQEEAAA